MVTNNVYIFGAYGTNNIGDDAIFLSMYNVYTKLGLNVIQVYVNKTNINTAAICYDEIYKPDFQFKPNSTLVIGGGGLFHCKQALVDYLKVATIAESQGVSLFLLGIGAEGVNADFEEEVIELCNIASKIKVRSLKSKEILDRLGINKKVEVVKDYVYNYDFDMYYFYPGITNPMETNIGLVTGGNGDKLFLTKLGQVLAKLMLDSNCGCTLYHIPHSRAYVGPNNNDVLTGEYLWSSMDIYHVYRESRFHLLDMPKDPNILYNRYKAMDGIIGMRYHSFIFSELTQKPLLGITSGLKSETYFKENNYGDKINANATQEELYNKLYEFIQKIKQNKLNKGE